MLIEKVVNKDNIRCFTNRELQFLTGLNSRAIWRFLKRCEKYNIVRPKTAKISNNGRVVYWKILNKDEFLIELQRRLE